MPSPTLVRPSPSASASPKNNHFPPFVSSKNSSITAHQHRFFSTCIVAAQTYDGRWILVGRWNPFLRSFHWEFPSGPMICGEHPKSAAAFELAREAGMCATNWQLIPKNISNKTSSLVMMGQGAMPHSHTQREDAFVPVRLTTAQEMNRLIKEGNICDQDTLWAWKTIEKLSQ